MLVCSGPQSTWTIGTPPLDTHFIDRPCITLNRCVKFCENLLISFYRSKIVFHLEFKCILIKTFFPKSKNMPFKLGLMIKKSLVLVKIKNLNILIIWVMVSIRLAWEPEFKTVYRIEKYSKLGKLCSKIVLKKCCFFLPNSVKFPYFTILSIDFNSEIQIPIL